MAEQHNFDKFPGNFMIFEHCTAQWRVSRVCPKLGNKCPICGQTIAPKRDSSCTDPDVRTLEEKMGPTGMASLDRIKELGLSNFQLDESKTDPDIMNYLKKP